MRPAILHAARDDCVTRVLYEQVNVVGRDHAADHAQYEALACLIHHVEIGDAVAGELEQEFAPVAAVSQVSDQTGQEVSIGSRHRGVSLALPCSPENDRPSSRVWFMVRA